MDANGGSEERVAARSSEVRAERRRGAALETALLDAVWDELQIVGYAGLTMEGVAKRAGTSRAVLYRRWHNRPAMVIAALRRHRPMLSGDIPDTGSLRGDVLALLRRISHNLNEVGAELIDGLLGDCFADPAELAHLQEQVLQIGSGVMGTILRRAAARGEARPDVGRRIATLPLDLFRHELLLTRAAPSDDMIGEIVDDIFLPLVRPA